MGEWGAVELEPEIQEWLRALSDEEFGQVEFYIDLLASKGVNLGEPYTKQLDGKLRELRFHLGSTNQRITYHVVSDRRIVLLTVFRKTRQRERREVERARRAMDLCIAEGHTADDDHIGGN